MPILRFAFVLLFVILAAMMIPFTFQSRLRIPNVAVLLIHSMPTWFGSWLQRVNVAVGMMQGQRPSKATTAFLIGFLVSLLGVVFWFVLARAINIELSILALAWVAALSSLLQLIPITPGGLGVREVSLVFLLGLYGVPEAQALAFSFLLFGITMIGALVGGVLEGWDIARSRNKKQVDGTLEASAVSHEHPANEPFGL